MTQQKLTGAALLAEVNQNPKMAATDLAVRCGYTKITRSRKGKERINPVLEAYYEALLLANELSFGVVLPESQKTSIDGTIISYKILKTGGAVIPRRFLRDVLDAHPDDYVFIEEGLDGMLLVKKDVARSEQAKLEPSATEAVSGTLNDEDEDENTVETDGETEADDESLVTVQQPALPGGVPSTTIRIPQSVS